jgi:hypothetical protein
VNTITHHDLIAICGDFKKLEFEINEIEHGHCTVEIIAMGKTWQLFTRLGKLRYFKNEQTTRDYIATIPVNSKKISLKKSKEVKVITHIELLRKCEEVQRLEFVIIETKEGYVLDIITPDDCRRLITQLRKIRYFKHSQTIIDYVKAAPVEIKKVSLDLL